MANLVSIIETYLMVLVHPFQLHQQFRHRLPILHHGGHIYGPLTLAEALSLSWVFAIIRGLAKILLLNYVLHVFLTFQGDYADSIFLEMIRSSGISTYYFLLFSAALDLIFFPVGTLIMTEVWAWIIRFYAGILDPQAPKEVIADQITTHALSSHLFNLIPFIGEVIQAGTYLFLLYAGLRSNLGTSRSLAWVILLTPTLIMLMLLSLLLVGIFYLAVV